MIEWIEASYLARSVITVPWAYPAISAMHIIGIALLFGSIVAVDLHLLRATHARFDAAQSGLVRAAVTGFIIAASTGLLLASVRISHYLENPAFLTKIAIIVLAGANAFLLRVLSGRRDHFTYVDTHHGHAAAALSIFLWTSAIVAGRWIAFT